MKMAFPYVKVIFEIGHESSVRNKRTPEGFTHDWELFVRGADNTDIHFFVEKVVFNLHDTFPNPKRVVKEPPYVVKESGYAGFPLPIEIYLKNKEEPRKLRFRYEIVLQERGLPPISKVTRETHVFSPSEDFRRKLIRGGGISVLTLDGTEVKNNPSLSPAISKPKSTTNTNRLPSPPQKKNKKEDIKLNNTFATLFGSPIQPSKLPLTTSKLTSQKLSSSDKSQVKIKSSPLHKEEKKDKERDKDKKKSKESSVDKVKKDKKEKTRDTFDKSKSLKQSSSKPDKKESTHHEKIKEKSADLKIDKKESKDKSKRDDKVKEKSKEKSHKEEKSYHEIKITKPETKIEFNDQEKKKHKSSPESIKVKSDKKLEKSEKSSKSHKSHKDHKKRDKRDKEEKLIKKEEKSNFVTQDTSFKHLDVPQTVASLDEFSKIKEEIPECSPPKANSSRVHDPETEDEFLSEDSELLYHQPEPPKPKEPEPPKKKLSPENSFTKKKKRKKKERDTEEPKQKVIRPEITEKVRETCSDISRSPSPSNKFTDEYINSLKHLQHKIMLLEDEDLQRVVTVIAETGHYEITTKTFDFDLCALNETTVKKLQELIT